MIRRLLNGFVQAVIRKHWVAMIASLLLIALIVRTRWGFIALVIPALVGLQIEALLNRKARLRAERVARGCCVACGYNLRGNESMICPECGEPCEKLGRMQGR